MPTGTLTKLGEQDFVPLLLTADQAYEITITGLSEFASIPLDAGAALAESGLTASGSTFSFGKYPAGTHVIYFMPTATGTYDLDVSDAYPLAASEPYTVTVTTTTVDYTDNPTAPGNVAVGGSTTATFTNKAQIDWIAVTLTANQAYEFTITGLSSYGTAQIGTAAGLAADGTSAASTFPTYVGAAGGEQQIYFMPATSGTYYVAVSDPDAPTTPETVTVAAATTTTDYADNTTTTGTVTVGGSPATLSFSNSGQHDWLAVSLIANQAYEVSLEQISGFGGFSAIGMNIGTDSASLAAEGSAAQAATMPPSNYADGFGNYHYYYMPATTGTYYVDVYDNSLVTTPAGFSVSVATVQADYTNNPSSPGTVAVGGEVSGQLANLGQNDWISMSLVANQAYELTITGLNNLYNSITLGTASFLAANTTDGGDSNLLGLPAGNQYLHFMPATSGTYYLDVNDYFNDDLTAPYTVSLATTTADYTDNPTAPGTVVAGGETTGTLTNIGQVDWIGVALIGGHNYEVTVSGLSDGGETRIGTASSLASDAVSATAITGTDIGIGGPSVTQYLDFTPATSGTYYITATDPFATAAPEAYTVEVSCFLTGTHIATPSGEVPVEQLSVGNEVMTLRGDARPIAWIGTGKALATRGRRSSATPVIVRKGALADNVPYCDLHITKGHSLHLDGVLIPVEFLVNHRSILWDDRAQEVTVYHIELDAHDVIIADGAPAESYRDDGNRWLFQNANSGWHLPPKLPYAPVLTGGPIVDAVWRSLLDRAGLRPGVPLTDDPDLHFLVDGTRVDAAMQTGDFYIFNLRHAPIEVRIVSRAGVPQELGLARDPRCLGVAVRRIVARQNARFRKLEADDALLSDGFHAFEAESGFRWTDGDAALPPAMFEGLSGPIEVVLHIGATTKYIEGIAATRAA